MIRKGPVPSLSQTLVLTCSSFPPSLLSQDLTAFEQALLENPLSLFVKYTFLYLFAGKMDGSHVVPFSPLFTDTKERVQCAVSTLCMIVAGALVYIGLEGGKEGGLARIGSIYMMPLLVFNAWITMVTYLQHHDEDTKVYAEGEWNYIKGALETIDREYGMGIDGKEGGREAGRQA